jgi:hypothetical protein
VEDDRIAPLRVKLAHIHLEDSADLLDGDFVAGHPLLLSRSSLVRPASVFLSVPFREFLRTLVVAQVAQAGLVQQLLTRFAHFREY